jgi:catechol 2,3-dioxygenase-like lactoylglutathione lyase family enzyme
VNDLPRSVTWYRDVLGFAVDREFQRDGRLFAASMRAGTVRLLLTQDDGAKGADQTKGDPDGFRLVIRKD